MSRKKLLSQIEQDEIEQIEIEKKDERNRSLGNAAKARAYELMICLYAITITLLVLFHMISLIAFFILVGIFAVCQVYFIVILWKYHKEM